LALKSSARNGGSMPAYFCVKSFPWRRAAEFGRILRVVFPVNSIMQRSF
jgi:hypothetical protein